MLTTQGDVLYLQYTELVDVLNVKQSEFDAL
jgi:hypothetical protein